MRRQVSDFNIVRGAAWLCVVLFGLQLALGKNSYITGVSIFAENGPVETLQFALLSLGLVALATEWYEHSVLKPVYGFLAMLYLSLCLRELDVREQGLPYLIEWTLGTGRPFWLVPLWLIAVVRTWCRREEIIQTLRTLDFTALLRVGFLTVVFFVQSNLAEKGIWPHLKQGREFGEESFEVLFSFCLMVFAFLAVRVRPSRYDTMT